MEPSSPVNSFNDFTANGGSVCSEYGENVIDWFEDGTLRAGPVQSETLRRILELNCGSEYLKKLLGDIKVRNMDACSLESLYTSLVPLASHEDFEPYIQRIADGDTTPLLTRQPITLLSLRVYPTRKGGKILELIYSSKQFKSIGGLTVGTATTHYYASEEFKIKQEKTKTFTCSPQEIISAGDYNQSMYCHLLLGLFFSDQVEFIASTFAYSIVQAFTAFEEFYKEIITDLKEGTLSSRITPQKMRKAVSDILEANPSLASRIEEICYDMEKSNWVGMIPKLWPNAKYVYSIMTGSMEPYLKKLRHYGGGMPLVSGDYGSTESWIGVNVDPSSPPENVTFAVVPTISYFEFMPLYRPKQDYFSTNVDDFVEDEPVPLSKVEVGKQYEIILTTFTGFILTRRDSESHHLSLKQFVSRSSYKDH